MVDLVLQSKILCKTMVVSGPVKTCELMGGWKSPEEPIACCRRNGTGAPSPALLKLRAIP